MKEFWSRSPQGQPKIFAHRGGAEAPENTLPAFDHALELGVDGFELDVRLTSDGVPVVLHDETLDRTTNARGPLSRFTWKDLEQVDAGYRFSGPKRTQIPTLEIILERYRSIPLILEIKENSVRLTQEVMRLVEAAGAFDHVMISGRHSAPARFARQYWHPIATGATEWEGWKSWVQSHFTRSKMKCSFDALQIPKAVGRIKPVTPRFLNWAHERGKAFHVWTVNAPSEIESYSKLGVDVIMTDQPSLARKVLGKAA